MVHLNALEDEIDPFRSPWEVDEIEFNEIHMGALEPSAYIEL